MTDLPSDLADGERVAETFEEAHAVYMQWSKLLKEQKRHAPTFAERRWCERQLKPIELWLRRANRLIARKAK